MKTKISFGASARLTVIAITPAILLDTLLALTDRHIPAWSLACLAIPMAYLYFGIQSVHSSQSSV